MSNAIVERQPLFAVYYNDPIEGMQIYTAPLKKYEMFKDDLVANRFVELEGVMLNTFHITKTEPLESVDEIMYLVYKQPMALRLALIDFMKKTNIQTKELLLKTIERIEKGYIHIKGYNC